MLELEWVSFDRTYSRPFDCCDSALSRTLAGRHEWMNDVREISRTDITPETAYDISLEEVIHSFIHGVQQQICNNLVMLFCIVKPRHNATTQHDYMDGQSVGARRFIRDGHVSQLPKSGVVANAISALWQPRRPLFVICGVSWNSKVTTASDQTDIATRQSR